MDTWFGLDAKLHISRVLTVHWVEMGQKMIFSKVRKSQKNISRQKSVNHFKTAYILNLSRTAKFGTRTNLSLIHITKLLHRTNNFVLWGKIACHVKRFCSTRPSKISMWSKIALHEICCSTDNVRSVRDKYDVCTPPEEFKSYK